MILILIRKEGILPDILIHLVRWYSTIGRHNRHARKRTFMRLPYFGLALDDGVFVGARRKSSAGNLPRLRLYAGSCVVCVLCRVWYAGNWPGNVSARNIFRECGAGESEYCNARCAYSTHTHARIDSTRAPHTSTNPGPDLCIHSLSAPYKQTRICYAMPRRLCCRRVGGWFSQLAVCPVWPAGYRTIYDLIRMCCAIFVRCLCVCVF